TREKSWRASNYVISPGVYGGDLLHGTASEDKLQGVLGVWITIPNLSPQMTHSIKSARKGHPAEDANITVTTDERERSVLVIGSGYGYTGLDPSSIDAEQLDLLYEATEDTARFLFPKGYEAAVEDGSLLASRRLCIRPWTASGLGLFEVQETDDGGRCIVTGGHNTGGFTQSLSVAQAVRATLLHRPHPMQELYHPNRLQGFLRATRL
ncbi:MAG: hypothetical protein QOH26_1151, partial [Actinomycetota bacterium]|nr:hypothetical protein [Actinomycetota bacterium]